MSPSLDGTLREYVMPQKNNSPLIFLHRFSHFVQFSWISIVWLMKFNHKCMHNHLRPNIPKCKSRGKIVKFVYSSIRQLYCCDITDRSIVPLERAKFKILIKTFKIIALDWIIKICPNVRFLKPFANHTICIIPRTLLGEASRSKPAVHRRDFIAMRYDATTGRNLMESK